MVVFYEANVSRHDKDKMVELQSLRKEEKKSNLENIEHELRSTGDSHSARNDELGAFQVGNENPRPSASVALLGNMYSSTCGVFLCNSPIFSPFTLPSNLIH